MGRAAWLVPAGAVAVISLIAATSPPNPANLPRPLAGALGSIEGWFDRQDNLGSPCEPATAETREGPAGLSLELPACWTLSAAGMLADPGLDVIAFVDGPRYDGAAWREMHGQLPGLPDATLGGRLFRTDLAPDVGEADPQAVFVYFLSDSAALRVQATVKNQFAASGKVAAHLDRLADVARSARPVPSTPTP